MKKLIVTIACALATSTVFAASYQCNDGGYMPAQLTIYNSHSQLSQSQPINVSVKVVENKRMRFSEELHATQSTGNLTVFLPYNNGGECIIMATPYCNHSTGNLSLHFTEQQIRGQQGQGGECSVVGIQNPMPF